MNHSDLCSTAMPIMNEDFQTMNFLDDFSCEFVGGGNAANGY